MNKIQGNYVEAIVYTDDVEEYAKAQIQLICDNEISRDTDIRVMPNLLGVDIGCGMLMAKVKTKGLEFQKLDKVIRENIPSGFAIRQRQHSMAEENPVRVYEGENFKRKK